MTTTTTDARNNVDEREAARRRACDLERWQLQAEFSVQRALAAIDAEDALGLHD